MWRRAGVVVAVLCLALAAGGCGPGGGVPGGVWGVARGVHGLGGGSAVLSVSCAAAGWCGAGGYVSSRFGSVEAVVVSQARGGWGRARVVPGVAALNEGRYAEVLSVSCASRGNCSAGGFYASRRTGGYFDAKTAAFAVSQVHGAWGMAREVPGIAALATGRYGRAAITSVSCASAGNCSAAGYYNVSSGNSGCCQYRAFAVSQVAGAWGTAQEIRGPAGLAADVSGSGGITSVSCASAGNCSAGGSYENKTGTGHAFIVSQVHGAWGTAREVPGTGIGVRGIYGSGGITSVSCASAGNCSAAGYGPVGSFVVSQVHGTWGAAQPVPGAAALINSEDAEVTSLSCASPGNCAAGGYASRNADEGSSTREYATAFVVTQTSGAWGRAEKVPGIAAFSKYGYAVVTTVSCASPGNCAAGGNYTTGDYNLDGSGPGQAFVVSQVNGAWQTARQVTTAPTNNGPAQITSMACSAPGRCSAVGYYGNTEIGPWQRAFTVSQGQ